jgi:hypothetical protein
MNRIRINGTAIKVVIVYAVVDILCLHICIYSYSTIRGWFHVYSEKEKEGFPNK